MYIFEFGIVRKSGSWLYNDTKLKYMRAMGAEEIFFEKAELFSSKTNVSKRTGQRE